MLPVKTFRINSAKQHDHSVNTCWLPEKGLNGV